MQDDGVLSFSAAASADGRCRQALGQTGRAVSGQHRHRPPAHRRAGPRPTATRRGHIRVGDPRRWPFEATPTCYCRLVNFDSLTPTRTRGLHWPRTPSESRPGPAAGYRPLTRIQQRRPWLRTRKRRACGGPLGPWPPRRVRAPACLACVGCTARGPRRRSARDVATRQRLETCAAIDGWPGRPSHRVSGGRFASRPPPLVLGAC